MNEGERLQPWQERWQAGQTRWDQGQAHPELERLLRHAVLEGGLQAGSRIFSGGCGRAHNEAGLAQMGYHVTAVDMVPEAIAEAQQLYGQQPGLRLACVDATMVASEERASYAAIFDRAMLCALQPQNRRAYIAASAARLQPAGLWMGILFRKVLRAEGPPFAIDEAEAMALFHEHYDLCFATACPAPLQAINVTEEWLCIWRLREV